MNPLKNRIYLVKTSDGPLLYHTTSTNPVLPDGEVIEVNPTYHASAGFMLGSGESVNGNHYIFQPHYGDNSGNSRRCLISWNNGSFSNGTWHISEGTVIAFNHYVCGRVFLSPSITKTEVPAWKSGAAVIEVSTKDGWVEIARLDHAGVFGPYQLPQCDKSFCPSIRLRGLENCDLDWLCYDFEATLWGRPITVTGKTDVREAGTGISLL